MKSPLKLALLLSLLLPGFSARAATPCSASAVQACFPALTLAAPGGNPGIPKVITWRDTTGASGVAWGTTSQITAANAYVTYNSGSAALQHNVPTGNIFGFLDNGVEHGYIQPAGTTEIFGADSGTIQIESDMADGATAKAVVAKPGVAFATAGAEDLSIQNGLTEKFGFKWDSGLVFNTTIKPAAADYGISQDGSNLLFNAPTAKGFGFNVNGTTQASITAGGAPTFGIHGTGINLTVAGQSNDAVLGGDGAGNGGFVIGNTKFLRNSSGQTVVQSNQADGATVVANIIQSGITFATAGAKLLSVQNNGTEKFGFKWDSGLTFNNTIQPNTADAGIGQDGSNDLVYGVPTAKSHLFRQAGSNILTLDNTTCSMLPGNVLGQKWAPVEASPTNVGGQVEISHIAGGSGAPTSPTAGTGCGTSSAPTVNAGSSDSSGDIQVVCGSAGTAGNPYLTITFAHAYNTAPNCVIFPANAQTAGGVVASDEFVSTTTGTLVINCGTGGTCTTNASALRWKYVCQQ